MTGMDWARADMDPDDPGSQGYSPDPGRETARQENAAKLAALTALVADREAQRKRTLIRLAALAGSLFTEDAVVSWFERPNRALHNRAPLDLIERGRADEVEQLLQGLADGVMG